MGAAGITAGAMLEATKIQTGQSAKNIAAEIAARSADVLTQTASAKAISDQQIAASVKTSELTTGTNRQNILDELTAHSADITKQLAAAGNEITIDATTGNSIIVNKQTGTVTPLKGTNGEPLKLPNTAMVQALQATINTTNEELRARNIQYSTDVKAAEADAERTAQRSDLFGDEKTAAINEARGNVQTVKNQYTNILNSLNERMQASAAALLSMQGVKMDGPAPVAPAGVPPGAMFSPGLKLWRTPDGALFDQSGKRAPAPGAPGASINQNSQQ
jgi:hypothetical protein